MTITPEQTEAEVNPARLGLVLSDFSLSEVFEGFYPQGESSEGFFTLQRADGTRRQPPQQHDRQEPSHKLIVNASWSYERDSEKLVLDGREIARGGVHIYLGDATDDNANAAHREFLLIDIPAALFEPLVNAVQRGDI